MIKIDINEPNAKVIIMFHRDEKEANGSTQPRLKGYFKKNRYNIIHTIHRHEDWVHQYDVLINILNVMRLFERKEMVDVVINEDYYKQPESLIATSLLWSLKELGLIEIYVYSSSGFIKPYDLHTEKCLMRECTDMLKSLISCRKQS